MESVPPPPPPLPKLNCFSFSLLLVMLLMCHGRRQVAIGVPGVLPGLQAEGPDLPPRRCPRPGAWRGVAGGAGPGGAAR